MNHVPTVGVAVLTLNAKSQLPLSLPPLLNATLKPRVLVVDSSSSDGTAELAQKMGAEVLTIPRQEFNHGLTREKARKHLNTDIVIFFTSDAYAVNTTVLETLIQPIKEKQAAIAYARQLPRENSGFFESFPREFNYPAESHIRGINDIQRYGSYIFFCSNSCAAYDNRALDAVGGFPKVLLGEDTVVTAKLLRNGQKIAYVAEACVTHSHRYTLVQEFKRYFDTGLARKSYQHIIDSGHSDQTHGKKFVEEMFAYVFRYRPLLIPYAILNTLAKWTGYRLGQASEHAPNWLKRALSSQPYFW